MAWNIPGGSGKDGRNPQRRGGGNAFDRVLEPLRGLFGGGNGGPGRWIAILLGLWLVLCAAGMVFLPWAAVLIANDRPPKS